MESDLATIVRWMAAAVELADSRRPVATNARTGSPFAPGIGPHSETETLALMLQELSVLSPVIFGDCSLGVPYPGPRKAAM